MTNAEQLAKESGDWIILETLRLLFEETDVSFPDGNLLERTFQVKDHRFLLLHGHNLRPNNLSQQVQNLKGQYVAKGIVIDYVLTAHIHSQYSSHHFTRNASLVGTDDYAGIGLHLSGKASQSLLIVSDDSISSYMIDLQNT
jgi:hypothetical protein